MQRFSPEERAAIAKSSGCHATTILKYEVGAHVQGATRQRIERALHDLGLAPAATP